MDTTKPHGFFLASFLVLVFLGELTEACGPCKERSLREACCNHDFMMRVHFVYVKRDPNFPIHINMFRINVIEVYKGPEYMRTVGVLYSPESDYYCGYHHKGPFNGEDYLIS
ncbi:putative Metalloprotein, partial [Naja naja]